MDNIVLRSFIRNCENDYMRFMGINTMPNYTLVPINISLDLVNEQGYGSPAAASYDVTSGYYNLKVWCVAPQLHADYLVFHEFTHILDAEMHSNKDKLKREANRGFSEYHAAQVDFMKSLGAESTNLPFSFSMAKRVNVIGGEKTALEFLMEPHDLATELINRKDFPASIETLAITLGLVFNYYGRRSICLMYANDYQEQVDNTSIGQLIHTDAVDALNQYMLGWFDNDRISLIEEFYLQMVISLAQQFELN